MIGMRANVGGQNRGLMRDDQGTSALPNEVVNQRVVATVWMSSRPDRTAHWGVGVWMDGEQADDLRPFTIDEAGWRGMDGIGLTPAEAKYVAACLQQAAERILNASVKA